MNEKREISKDWQLISPVSSLSSFLVILARTQNVWNVNGQKFLLVAKLSCRRKRILSHFGSHHIGKTVHLKSQNAESSSQNLLTLRIMDPLLFVIAVVALRVRCPYLVVSPTSDFKLTVPRAIQSP